VPNFSNGRCIGLNGLYDLTETGTIIRVTNANVLRSGRCTPVVNDPIHLTPRLARSIRLGYCQPSKGLFTASAALVEEDADLVSEDGAGRTAELGKVAD